MGWDGIPYELRERAQWAVAGVDKAPQWVTGDRLRYVSVKEPAQWGAFADACEVASINGMHLGYILSADDPFSCIDLDVKDASNEPNSDKWTKAEDFQRYQSIVDHMQSYAEVSRSGKGIHIWVRGNIGPGVRRDGVEVYSQERFIICTGNTINALGIEDRQDMLSSMVQQMRPVRDELAPPLVELEPIELDIDIINRGFNASNGAKFKQLWSGDWGSLNYPSQSEADYALINMLAFYTPSNEQVRRVFRESALGQRKKAQRNDYINRALLTIRRELEEERSVDVAGMQAAMETLARMEGYKVEEPILLQPPAESQEDEIPEWMIEKPVNGHPIVAQTSPELLDWPPGFVGYLAQIIFNMAPRPIKEIAIATAIAHVAGLTGRAWNVSETGLNIYIAVVARSATGKNIIHSSMNKLSKQCSAKFPMYRNFIDGSNYVSSEAFEKSLRSRVCSVHHIKELGKLMTRMNSGKDQIMANYARSILDVYDVSGRHDNLGDIVRSKKEDSVAGVMGPVAFSLIGESTPDVFRKATTAEAIEDGLMSRFLVIEYKGDRPEQNEHPAKIPEDVIDWLVGMAQQANQLINHNQVVDIRIETGAKEAADLFNKYCDSRIVGQTKEARRFVWNRAHLMALKIAGILAVADNYYDPIITEERMNYAVNLLKISINSRLPIIDDATEADDSNREFKLKKLLGDYLLRDAPAGEELGHATGVISYRFMRQRIHQISAFKHSRDGASRALNNAISIFKTAGILQEIPRGESYNLFKKTGTMYRINLTKRDLDEVFAETPLQPEAQTGLPN